MSKFSKDFIEGFIGVIVMAFWAALLNPSVLAGIAATAAGTLYGAPLYARKDLEGNGFGDNHINLDDMANWYNTHQYRGARGEKFDWAEKPFGWSENNYGFSNGIRTVPWYKPNDGEDQLRTAFELANKINPNKYSTPVNDTDLYKAYMQYAKDGFFELGDDGNLWDLYARDNSLNHAYKPVQHANWLAAYRDDVNYLAKLAEEAGEDSPYGRQYRHFLNMATSDGASQLDRQIFRENLEKIHALRMQNPNRFFEEKDTEDTKGTDTGGNAGGSGTGSKKKRDFSAIDARIHGTGGK